MKKIILRLSLTQSRILDSWYSKNFVFLDVFDSKNEIVLAEIHFLSQSHRLSVSGAALVPVLTSIELVLVRLAHGLTILFGKS